MALPQEIRPINSELADSITGSSEMPWIETKPGQAWTKVLWVGQESGRWAVLLKWKKGYVAPPHKHLSGAFAFVLSGKLQVRNNVYRPGDFLHEVNGMVHGSTTALEDATEYLFFATVRSLLRQGWLYWLSPVGGVLRMRRMNPHPSAKRPVQSSGAPKRSFASSC